VAAVAAGAAAAALTFLSLRLWLDNRQLKRDLRAARGNRGIRSGLPVGAPAPGFVLRGVDGQAQSLDALRAPGRPIALVFMDPGCGPCQALLPDLKRWQMALSEALTIAVISRDTNDETDPGGGKDGLANVLLQKRSEVSNAYRIPGSPSAIIVSPAGTIASAPASGTPAIEALIRLTV
jgi:thiol-disulfide isomerase/thioredoxin